MLAEAFLFLFAGILVGVIFGLLPGIHPNIIILFVPLLASLSLDPILVLTFVVSIGVANNIVYFLPSILLGVPESGSELSILPGHKMLLEGHGMQAVKLTIVGSLGSAVLCTVSFPILLLSIPLLFDTLSGFIHLFLITITAIMILTEEGKNKLFALVLFLVSGFIGILGLQLPIDNTLLLFPIFCGFFGVSTLLLQLRNSVEMPKQHASETYVSKRLINTSVISGWLAGVFSGLLPGIGASEIASIVSSGKNEHSFLVRLGAITMANVILSILALWLIGKSRSGLSLVIEQLMQIGLNETLLVLATALIATGIASMVAIVIAQKSLSFLKDVGYNNLGTATVLFIIVLSAAFAGPYGLLLLATCTSIGLLTNIAKVKRGILMGVLILPTIVFYLP